MNKYEFKRDKILTRNMDGLEKIFLSIVYHNATLFDMFDCSLIWNNYSSRITTHISMMLSFKT